MPDEMEEVEADEEEEEAEVELENEAVDDENFEDESGDEDSSVSSDDGEEEEELTNKISKNEKIIQSSTKGKEKKLPPPRKTKRNKKVRSIIKKVGRVKGKTNKVNFKTICTKIFFTYRSQMTKRLDWPGKKLQHLFNRRYPIHLRRILLIKTQ